MSTTVMQGEVIELVGNSRRRVADRWQSFGIGWMAYPARILGSGVLRAALLVLLPAAVARDLPAMASYAWLVYVGAALVAAGVVYDVACLRATRLYTDRDGVWLESGILPWTRGTTGVKWRDVGEAVCYTGFLPWVTRCYTIRVGHRFTNGIELVVPHVWLGHHAVGHVNDVLINPS